jgi:hypothetical protein
MKSKEEIIKRIEESRKKLEQKESKFFSASVPLDEIASIRELRREIQVLEWILEE